jgi:TolB protein
VAFFDLADDELWIGERGATRVRNVSQFADEIDVMPSWSPDGTRLAFASFRSGGSDIYVVNADGSGLRNLMPSESPAVHFDDAPAWSPDGTRIAFATDRAGHRAIWTMRPDGTDLVQLTADPDARDYEPSWSPDGRRLVVRRVRTESGGARTDLAIVNVADGSVVELRRPGTERYPSWSPDGAWIAYASDAVGGEFRIFTVRPDGSENVERAGGTAFGRHALYPRWIRRP